MPFLQENLIKLKRQVKLALTTCRLQFCSNGCKLWF
jgi:hypothetical protein